jgi:hypothetical protein
LARVSISGQNGNREKMEEQLLREIAGEYLLPLLSGATLLPKSRESSDQGKCVSITNSGTIEFKVDITDSYRLVIRRSWPFYEGTEFQIPSEKEVVDAFVAAIREIAPGLSEIYKQDLFSRFQRRLIAKALALALARHSEIGTASPEAILLDAIDQLDLWATRLYEGKPIAAGLGFLEVDKEPTSATVSFDQICREDFSCVLSNGMDTLLAFDFQGRLRVWAGLPQSHNRSWAPYRLGPIAEWSDGADRVALALDRLGEILVFMQGRLVFARRSGKWHFLIHNLMVEEPGRGEHVYSCLDAVYSSCLDASFARTGACVGLVAPEHRGDWKTLVPSKDDHLDAQRSVKTKAIKQMVGKRRFDGLDRRMQQELLAIDGATLLDDAGHILAVGAIVKVPGGSTGGGRLAAAKELSKLGLGIKVSQDGGIRGFRNGNSEEIFSVM